ncbi:MAG: hypothetical protein ACI856_002282 [Kiritimatiellia bacterium]|jgi:hypothetical protein
MQMSYFNSKLAVVSMLGLLAAIPAYAEVEQLATVTNETAVAVDTNAVEMTASSGLSGLATIGGRVGSSLQEYYGGLLVPFFSYDDDVLFFDLRGSLLDDREQEINAGLVARRLLEDRNAIFGLNVYYDGRWTDEGNFFSQVGVGAEYLSTLIDARANYYEPLDDAETLSESVTTATSTSGSVRTTETRTTRVYEEALSGFDAEAGIWLPFMEETIPTGLFVGYFDFESDVIENISGVKVRIESKIHERLTLDAEWFDDETLNQSEFLVGLRLSIPFGDIGEHVSSNSSIATRMNEMVQRDFRIRTINTGPVLQGLILTETTVQSTRRSVTPVAVVMEEAAAPICFLNDDGDVVCR